MKKILMLLLLAVTIGATAQDKKGRPTSYNYQRGMEAIQNEKVDEALEYFNKDLQENPKNGYAYTWVAVIKINQEEYGEALTAANMAIKLLPKKDAEYVSSAYSARSAVYLCLEDTVKGLADLATAIKITPKDSKLYDKRAQIYYEQDKYDLADADYHKMIELDAGDVMGYMGIGRNANEQKRWDDAIKQFDYVIKLNSNYSSGYSFRAESYLGKEKWDEATDDIVTALGIDWDDKAYYLAATLKEPAFTMLVSKMKVQSAKSPNEATWPYIIGIMYETNKQYAKAIEYYEATNSKDASDNVYRRIAVCQNELGYYDEALSNINQAINMDSTVTAYQALRANIYYDKGDAKSAIAEWDHILASQPESGSGYYSRGWVKQQTGDLEGAIEDFSMATVLEPKYSAAYACRGDIYMKQGKKELAEADFKKVIEIEDTPEQYTCIHYAYQGLGDNAKAIAAIDSIIARDSTEAGHYYDAACLYSRMKDKTNALKYLEKSLELGYNSFAHIERDYDMDFLRDTDEFKALIKKYQSACTTQAKTQSNKVAPKEVVLTEVPFTKENGVCKIKCQINGLPLHFVFDTGASDVTLSMVEANFMMKNGYLSKNDVIGSQSYMDANGDINVGTVINIKNVNFGGLNLNNIRASVVQNQKAPLLLGQSVLARLGKIEIDNAKRVIKIQH